MLESKKRKKILQELEQVKYVPTIRNWDHIIENGIEIQNAWPIFMIIKCTGNLIFKPHETWLSWWIHTSWHLNSPNPWSKGRSINYFWAFHNLLQLYSADQWLKINAQALFLSNTGYWFSYYYYFWSYFTNETRHCTIGLHLRPFSVYASFFWPLKSCGYFLPILTN